MTVVNDVGTVDQAQRLADVVVCNQHPDAAVGQVPDQLLDVADGYRVDAGEGLVEKYERGPRRQRAGDLAAPPLAA